MSVNYRNSTTGELVTLANGSRMWIGTKAAHDAAVTNGKVPNNCMVCITDDYPTDETDDYSTDETKTFKHWIDGKPIYRKCFTSVVPANSTTFNVGDVSFDTLITLKGSVSITPDAYGTQSSLPYWRNTNDWVSLRVTSGHIQVEKATVNVWYDASKTATMKFILEYTKTTD